MKKWLLLITINFSLNLCGQHGGVKSFQATLHHSAKKSINNNLNNRQAQIRLQKQILSAENFILKNPLQQVKVDKSIISLKEKKEPVSTLGNQIDFFNTEMLEHIITGESDVTLLRMNFKILGLTVEVSENKITGTSLILETGRFLIPAITFTYEPGVPALLMAGFIFDF